ncbi:hypothetical protein BT69DRAFT_1320022 [Atractiella rhizophila]|nr:hypothetical protein BT69DRAFT_1320022 [Atractiella rhizophila]
MLFLPLLFLLTSAVQHPFPIPPPIPAQYPLTTTTTEVGITDGQNGGGGVRTEHFNTIPSLLSLHPTLYSRTLSLLQRTRLIPYFNGLKNHTFFAPTNQAWDDLIQVVVGYPRYSSYSIEGGTWEDVEAYLDSSDSDDSVDSEDNEEDGKGRDNIKFTLRQALLYHLIPYRNLTSLSLLPPSPPLLRLPTHLFPTPSFTDSLPLLDGEPQKLRLAFSPSSPSFHKEGGGVAIGTDWKGEGGVNLLPFPVKWVTVGRKVGVGEEECAWKVPEGMEHDIIKEDASLSTFRSLLPAEVAEAFEADPHLTVFAPTNAAFDRVGELEMTYLRSNYSGEEVLDLARFHTASSNGTDRIGYLNRLLKSNVAHTLNNASLEIALTEDGDVAVNGTKLERGDVFASNGVLHTLPSLLVPQKFFDLTPEKYLVGALNATRFVSLLKEADLSHYINSRHEDEDDTESWTILAPRDDVPDLIRLEAMLRRGSSLEAELKDVLQYHVLPGKLTADELARRADEWVHSEEGEDAKVVIVESEMKTMDLRGGRQRLEVALLTESKGKGKKGGDDDALTVTKGKATVSSFNGVSIVGKPVEVGNSIIYILSRVLSLPPPPISVALSASPFHLSTFVAALYAVDTQSPVSLPPSLPSVFRYNNLDSNSTSLAPGVTWFAPTNEAFEKLGLTERYLMTDGGKADLRKVIQYLAVNEVALMKDFGSSEEKQRWETLLRSGDHTESAERVLIGKGEGSNNRTIFWGERNATVVAGDYLTQTGVMHIVDRIELPAPVTINNRKLLQGAKATTMEDLIRRVNMTWILGDSDSSSALNASSYTILCPTDKAFSRINLTRYLEDEPALIALVRLHIIPPQTNIPINDDSSQSFPLGSLDQSTFETLLSQEGKDKYGKLAFRNWGGNWLVGIKNARGDDKEDDWARITNFGRTTGKGNVGGAIEIDTVLIPYRPGWFWRWGWIVVWVIVAVMLLAVVVWSVVLWIKWRRSGYQKVPTDEEGREEDEEEEEEENE